MILKLEGIELECYFEYTPPEPDNGIRERADLVAAFIGDVDISPLLSFDQLSELEAMCLLQSY
jgi:hypothetical protein